MIRVLQQNLSNQLLIAKAVDQIRDNGIVQKEPRKETLMLIAINRRGPFSTKPNLYLSTRQTDHGHVSKMQMKLGTGSETVLIDEIDATKLRLLEREDATYQDYIPADFRVGLAICELSSAEQVAFWDTLEPHLAAYYSRYTNPAAARKNWIVYLPGTQFGHINDASDELQAFLTLNHDNQTVIGFGSQIWGVPGPDLMLAN